MESNTFHFAKGPLGPCSPPALGLQGKSFSLPFPPLKCSTRLGITSSRMSACFLFESSVVSGLEPVTCGPATARSDLEGTGGQRASCLPVSPPFLVRLEGGQGSKGWKVVFLFPSLQEYVCL